MITRTEQTAIAADQKSRRRSQQRHGEPAAEFATTRPFAQNIVATAALLGGPKILRAAFVEMLDVHSAIVQGLPAATLVQLKRSLVHLNLVDVTRALGLSDRTIRRHVEQNSGRLGTALGSRVWRFAELLSRATIVFGSQEKAERWLSSNVMGLDGRRPIDLLQTSVGAKLIDEFLSRLEYGVYT